MQESRSTIRSPYTEFAKLRSHARYSLATSGVMNYPLADLPVSLADLEVSGPSYYGYEPLLERLVAKCGTRPECVVHATGTSMANHLAMAASIESGDEVLIEKPAYELVVTAAQYLGAVVQRFQRRFEQNFRLDPEEVERHVTTRTRLIVVTNLLNPSGALADETTLGRVGEIAAGVGARVLARPVLRDAGSSSPGHRWKHRKHRRSPGSPRRRAGRTAEDVKGRRKESRSRMLKVEKLRGDRRRSVFLLTFDLRPSTFD
jgi:aminotransferase class I and II